MLGVKVNELLTLKQDKRGLHVLLGVEVNELLAFKFVLCIVGDGSHRIIYIQICPLYCWGWKLTSYLHSSGT